MMGFQQTVIRFENDKGQKVREVVHHTKSEIKEGNFFGRDCLVFFSQIDGARNILDKRNIIEMFVEEEDMKYGTMTRVRDIEI
jgi:hypothetical protein